VPYGTGNKSGGTAFANLLPVMPNPVTHRANFSFDLRKAGRVQLSVYDVSGRRVAKLMDASMAAGVHTVAWDARTDGGLRLESGVYMYELSMGGERLSRRLILTH
jgi:flagellar hook assembly protein FlgD